MRLLGTSVKETVGAYAEFLEVCYPDHRRMFQDRLATNEDAARAEAVVFSWLRHMRMDPAIAEAPDTGGMDFLCMPPAREPFLLEVTALDRVAVEQRSGWPDELNDRIHTFSMITPSLWSTARRKAPQLAGHEVARVLAICLSHVGAAALLGTLAAEWLMTSETMLSIPIAPEGPLGQPQVTTNASKSAFFRLEGGQIVACRQSISAILLVAIWDNQIDVVGLLHPEPTIALNYRVFGELPFLKVQWPIEGAVIRTEWVVADPRPAIGYHQIVTLTNDELKGEHFRWPPIDVDQ